MRARGGLPSPASNVFSSLMSRWDTTCEWGWLGVWSEISMPQACARSWCNALLCSGSDCGNGAAAHPTPPRPPHLAVAPRHAAHQLLEVEAGHVLRQPAASHHIVKQVAAAGAEMRWARGGGRGRQSAHLQLSSLEAGRVITHTCLPFPHGC